MRSSCFADSSPSRRTRAREGVVSISGAPVERPLADPQGAHATLWSASRQCTADVGGTGGAGRAPPSPAAPSGRPTPVLPSTSLVAPPEPEPESEPELAAGSASVEERMAPPHAQSVHDRRSG